MAAEDHILAVTTERSYYKHICEESKENIHHLCLSNGRFNAPSPGMRNPPRTCDTVVHYSFDMAGLYMLYVYFKKFKKNKV